MTSLLLHDTGRGGKLGWMVDDVQQGRAAGAVLCATNTPLPSGVSRRPGIEACVSALHDVGARVFLDPTTHLIYEDGAQTPEWYADWEWWDPSHPELTTDSGRRAHIERVFATQQSYGLPLLAPTVRIDGITSPRRDIACRMAELAVEIDPDCFLMLVGDAGFWSQGSKLDDVIGELAQLRPTGWYLVAYNAPKGYGPEASSVAGICRSTHSLSLRSEVIVGHADLGVLPAVAAGATTIGTGYDQGQRALAPDALAPGATGGTHVDRVTFEGLLAVLGRDGTEEAFRYNSTLAASLLVGPSMPQGLLDQCRHHFRGLHNVANAVASSGNRREMASELQRRYGRSRQ